MFGYNETPLITKYNRGPEGILLTGVHYTIHLLCKNTYYNMLDNKLVDFPFIQ